MNGFFMMKYVIPLSLEFLAVFSVVMKSKNNADVFSACH